MNNLNHNKKLQIILNPLIKHFIDKNINNNNNCHKIIIKIKNNIELMLIILHKDFKHSKCKVNRKKNIIINNSCKSNNKNNMNNNIRN